MQRWTTIPLPYGPDEEARFLAHVREGWGRGSEAAFAIEFEGQLAGHLDLRLEEGSWAEVGYAAAPWVRGQGVMTRCLRMALHWAFTTLDLEGVHWRALGGNTASKRVAEKGGFRMEGNRPRPPASARQPGRWLVGLGGPDRVRSCLNL